MTKVLFTAVSFGLCIISLTAPRAYSASETEPVRILCVGDSITRGTLLGRYESGPYKGQGIGLPNPHGGGYRKYLQDMLRAAGIRYEFVGQLTFGAYGKDGVVDPDFSPHHQGLPGWGNRDIMLGYNQNKENTPPTVKDVLDSQGGKATVIKDIATVLHEYHPDVVLLMSGSNGHNAKARDELIGKIVEHFKGPMLVATIPPQKAPRVGWENTAEYNASLPETINRLKADGAQLQMVDVFHAVQESEIADDGVHPNAEAQKAIATAFFSVLEPTLRNLKLNK